MNLTESKLRKIIKESVKRILRESEIEDKVQALMKSSRTYRPDDGGNKLRFKKIWNRGRGCMDFFEILPDEGVVLYNGLIANKRDLERIKEAFPNYKIIKVEKSYYEHCYLHDCM